MESPEPFDTTQPAPPAEALRRALAFFTRLPIGTVAAGPLAECVLAFAPVGALIGLAVGVSNLLARGLGLPLLLAALVAVAIGIILTGALHEDGLADSADALGGSSVQQRLDIMRDSRSGSYGVLALIFSVSLRSVAIAGLGGWTALFVLIGAHAVSRGAIAAMLHGLEPARRDGLGAEAGKPALHQTQLAVGIGIAVLLISGLFASILGSILALLLAAAAGLAVAGLANRKLGGYTGDVLGALQQSIEITVLIAFALWI